MKIHVISQRGKLVGTYIPQPPPADPKSPVCKPIAGPGQKLHELEIANAEAYYKERRSGELHELVQKKLKLK